MANQTVTFPKHTGILASAVQARARALGQDLIRKREQENRAASKHVGVIGERVSFALTVERVADVDTQYGTLHIHTLRDVDGNALVWKTASKRLEVGAAVTGKCTVKKHADWKGEAQTELARCNF